MSQIFSEAKTKPGVILKFLPAWKSVRNVRRITNFMFSSCFKAHHLCVTSYAKMQCFHTYIPFPRLMINVHSNVTDLFVHSSFVYICFFKNSVGV